VCRQCIQGGLVTKGLAVLAVAAMPAPSCYRRGAFHARLRPVVQVRDGGGRARTLRFLQTRLTGARPLRRQESIRTAFLLSQGGEFAFVLLSLANELKVRPFLGALRCASPPAAPRCASPLSGPGRDASVFHSSRMLPMGVSRGAMYSRCVQC